MFWHPDKYDAPIRFQVNYAYERQALELFAVRRQWPDKVLVPTVTWTEHEPGNRVDPLLSLNDREGEHQMQGLFDALWASGFRPRQDVKPEAIVAAKNEHIQDLRNIIGKLFDK